MALTAQQLDDFNRQILRFVRQLPEPTDAVNVLGSALASMLAAQWYDEPAKIQRALDQLRADTLDAAAANRASPTALVVTLGERRGKFAPAAARVFMSGAPLDESIDDDVRIAARSDSPAGYAPALPAAPPDPHGDGGE